MNINRLTIEQAKELANRFGMHSVGEKAVLVRACLQLIAIMQRNEMLATTNARNVEAAAEQLKALEEREERLRLLVKTAFEEGHWCGNTSDSPESDWNRSDALKALSNEVSDAG